MLRCIPPSRRYSRRDTISRSVLLSESPRLLCVFAHPDDEGFGTCGMLVTCVERGVEVHLVSATPGDADEIGDPTLATPETPGAVRRQELARACEILGARPPEVPDYPDGCLGEVEPAELEREIVRRIRALRPRIVLTFDANGAYGHPDHIAIHHRTVAAFEAADPTRHSEIGPAPHRPAKLYFTAYARSLLNRIRADTRRRDTALEFGDVQTIPDAEVGTEDARITSVVDVREVFERRWAARRAHRTQFGHGSLLSMMPDSVLREWMAYDTFIRAWPPPDESPVRETDVLDGLLAWTATPPRTSPGGIVAGRAQRPAQARQSRSQPCGTIRSVVCSATSRGGTVASWRFNRSPHRSQRRNRLHASEL